MPNIPGSRQQGGRSAPEEVLDALLTGDVMLDDQAAALRPVAGLLAALTAGPARHELAGHAQALAEFRRWDAAAVTAGTGRQVRFVRDRRLRPRLRSARLATTEPGRQVRSARDRRLRPPLRSVRLATAGGALAAVLGGLVTAAYADMLPAPAQRLAHDIIGAPAPRPAQHPGGEPATPSGAPPAGPAAWGLCTAYARAQAHGTAAQQAAALRKLAAVAGGAGNVDAYCAVVPRPARSPSARHSPRSSGKSATHPAGKPATPPTPKPATHPTGKPSALPSPQTSSRPATHPPAESSLSSPAGATSRLVPQAG